MAVGAKIKGTFQRWFNKANNTLRAPILRVGYLDGATYPNGNLVAMIAAIHEYGAPNARWPIPPRPWMRPTIQAHRTVYPEQIGKLLVQYNYDGMRTLDTMGQFVVADMRRTLAQIQTPPLSPVTVMVRSMRRGNPNLPQGIGTVYRAIGRVRAGRQPRSGTSTKPLVGQNSLLLTRLGYEVRRR